MTQREWEPGDNVWAKCEGPGGWMACTVEAVRLYGTVIELWFWRGVVKEFRKKVHGMTRGPKQLRPRNPSLQGSDKPRPHREE